MDLFGCFSENENLIKQPQFTIETGKNNLYKTRKQPLQILSIPTRTTKNICYHTSGEVSMSFWNYLKVYFEG